MKGVRSASIEELQAVPGIGPALASVVHSSLHPTSDAR
jgi:DNA uptake protein ComE-like DNA-binding protein